MTIDITKLNQGLVKEIPLDEDVSFLEEILQNSEILHLKDVHLSGNLFLDEEQELVLAATLNGVMVLADSISLEPVDYPFSIEIEEKIEKKEEIFENTLDILDILWQNIVLEVPLRFTKVEDYSKLQGEGWKLLSEEEATTSNNPFEDLKSMFGKE